MEFKSTITEMKLPKGLNSRSEMAKEWIRKLKIDRDYGFEEQRSKRMSKS
jgi:hypothetical protein